MQCDGKAVRGLLWSFFTSLITRCALVTLCDSSTSPGLCLARCSKPNHRIRTSTPALGLKRCLFSSQPHMQSKYYSSNMFLVVLVSSGALNFKWKHDKAVGVLTFSPGCGCSRPYYSNSRAGCAKKKKKKKGGTISRQFIKFQCKHPRITAKGQRFNTAASVSIQTWALSLKQEKMSPSPNTIWLRWWCVYGDSSSLWQKSLPLRTALSCTLMWWGCHADRKPERRAEIGPVLAPRLFWPVCLFKLAQLVTVVQRINLPASHFRAHLQRFWARAQLFVDGEKPTSQLPYVNLCVRVYLI